MPNSKTINLTHIYNLDIPWLPEHMTKANIVSGPTHASLILTQKFCDTGYKVLFDTTKCRVYYKDKLVLHGGHNLTTGLWRLAINPAKERLQKQYTNNKLDL